MELPVKMFNITIKLNLKLKLNDTQAGIAVEGTVAPSSFQGRTA